MTTSARVRSWAHRLATAACVLAVPGGASAAQRQTAVLEGTVQDSTGAVVTQAVVRIRDADTNLTRTAQTDSFGTFRFSDLPIATYEVRVTSDGFTAYAHAGVTLAIAQTARMIIVLQPAGIVEEVSVSAQPPPLDSRQTSVATVIDTERIEELPVRSRNYLEFVLLAPGVTRVSPPPTGGAVTSILPSSGFSFQGLRPRSNTLTIDGIDNIDEFSGSSRTELSLEVVREFQVVKSGWLAETAGGSAGSINVVTKSGANTLHGDAFAFGQSGIFNAQPKLEETLGAKPALRRYRAGAAIGGAISRDRTFYYAAAEREGTRDQTASDISPSAANAINRVLDAGLLLEIGTRQLTIGLFPTARNETEASVKLSHTLDGRGLLVGALAVNQNTEDHDAFNRGGLSDPSARGSATTRDVAGTASWNTTLTPRTTNELRGQVAPRRQTFETANPHGPGVTISGVADFGTSYVGDADRRQSFFEIGDSVTRARGQHLLKIGAGFKRTVVDGTVADGMRGLYVFGSLDSFVAGRPDVTRIMSGEASVDFAVSRASGFVQDHWTPAPALTIDAGVRFDAEAFPASLGMTSRQLGPRVGIAWTLGNEWVIHGSVGRFADRVVLASVERALSAAHDGIVEHIDDGDAPARTPSTYTVRPGPWNPAIVQASVGAERLVTPNVTASVTYLYSSGRNLARTVNVNLAPPILTTANAAALGVDAPTSQQVGRPVFGPGRLNPAWDAIFELQPTAASTYQGVTLSLNRRLANDVEWACAYTWSHARDSASDFDEQPQNPYALADEWADSRYDQRHRFVASALFDLPIGEEEDRQPGKAPGAWVRAFSHIEIAPILTVGSGGPVNVVTGGDDNRTGAFPFTSRPLGLSRNAARLPSSASLDLRVLKYFNIKPHGKLDLVVEVFNLLNRTNVSQINPVYGSLLTPRLAFGRPIEAGIARQIQFSLDFEF
jgi:Carboxypeptidase regulatory-like domain/TonB dependent receptor